MIADLRLEGLYQTVTEAGRTKITLAPLTARLPAGMLHVVCGSPGAGKSTLLAILSLAAAPAGGELHCGGELLTGLGADAARRWRRLHIGTMCGDDRLVPLLTVAENIHLAAAARESLDAAERGMAILAGFGFENEYTAFPAALTAGETRCVLLAQALLAEPAIIIADDPAAGLGSAEAARIGGLLRAYAHERHAIVICASDDNGLLAAADNLVPLRPA